MSDEIGKNDLSSRYYVRVCVVVQMHNSTQHAVCYVFVSSVSLISSITIGLPRFLYLDPHPPELIHFHLQSNPVMIHDTRTCFTVLFHR